MSTIETNPNNDAVLPLGKWRTFFEVLGIALLSEFAAQIAVGVLWTLGFLLLIVFDSGRHGSDSHNSNSLTAIQAVTQLVVFSATGFLYGLKRQRALRRAPVLLGCLAAGAATVLSTLIALHVLAASYKDAQKYNLIAMLCISFVSPVMGAYATFIGQRCRLRTTSTPARRTYPLVAKAGHLVLEIFAVLLLCGTCLFTLWVVLWFVGTLVSILGQHIIGRVLHNAICHVIYFAVVGGMPVMAITFGTGFLARRWFTLYGVCLGWLIFAYGFSLCPAVGLLNAALIASWGIVTTVCGMRFGIQRRWWYIALPVVLTVLVVVIWR